MTTSPTTTTTHMAALAQNRAELQRETDATVGTITRTLQAMQSSLEALRNENALLRTELADSRRQVSQLVRDQEAARVASAAIERQLASQQRDAATTISSLNQKLDTLERKFTTHTHPYYICCSHCGYNCSCTPRTTEAPKPQQ